MSDYHKQRKALKRASHGSTKPFYGTYISVRDTKMAGPYGVLDGEDLKKPEMTRFKMAEGEGFEPSEGVNPQPLSRRLFSATQAPFQRLH